MVESKMRWIEKECRLHQISHHFHVCFSFTICKKHSNGAYLKYICAQLLYLQLHLGLHDWESALHVVQYPSGQGIEFLPLFFEFETPFPLNYCNTNFFLKTNYWGYAYINHKIYCFVDKIIYKIKWSKIHGYNSFNTRVQVTKLHNQQMQISLI